jgi:pSer/pThr/pTyr-binding forkhead associated (FHA) protein
VAKIIISRDGQVLREVELVKERMTLGRHPSNDIVIEERTVSGQHAAFTTILNDAFLEDLGSTNGTFVNGQRIVKHVLAPKDKIALSKFQIEFIQGPRAAVPSAAPSAAPAALLVASIAVLNGANAGKSLTLSKPLTTLGRPGVCIVVISRQQGGYAIAHIEGTTVPTLDGAALAIEPRLLASGQVIDLAGTQMRFDLM